MDLTICGVKTPQAPNLMDASGLVVGPVAAGIRAAADILPPQSYPQEKALITIRIRVIMMIEIGLVQFRRIRLTLFHNKERLRC